MNGFYNWSNIKPQYTPTEFSTVSLEGRDPQKYLEAAAAPYQPGGAYGSYMQRQWEESAGKAGAQYRQSLVGGGLGGTTMAGKAAPGFGAEEYRTYQMGVEAERGKRLGDIYMTAAQLREAEKQRLSEEQMQREMISAELYKIGLQERAQIRAARAQKTRQENPYMQPLLGSGGGYTRPPVSSEPTTGYAPVLGGGAYEPAEPTPTPTPTSAGGGYTELKKPAGKTQSSWEREIWAAMKYDKTLVKIGDKYYRKESGATGAPTTTKKKTTKIEYAPTSIYRTPAEYQGTTPSSARYTPSGGIYV